MLCSNCGGELTQKGTDIEGEEIYECKECEARYRQEYTELESGQSDEKWITDDVPVLDDVKLGIIHEITAHVFSGQLDFRFLDSESIVFECYNCMYPIPESEINFEGDTIYCPYCEEEKSLVDVRRSSTLGYFIQRFGVQYRDMYELDVRRDREVRYNLPALPPEAVWVGATIGSGILQGLAWDTVKSRIQNIRENDSEPVDGMFDSSELNQQVPDSPISYTYKAHDLLEIVRSDAFVMEFINTATASLSKHYMASQQDMTLDEYLADRFNAELKETLQEYFSDDEVEAIIRDSRDLATIIREKSENSEEIIEEARTYDAEVFPEERVNKVQSRILDGDLNDQVPEDLELESIVNSLSVNERTRSEVRDELDELTRDEIVHRLIGDFTEGLNEALRINGSEQVVETQSGL